MMQRITRLGRFAVVAAAMAAAGSAGGRLHAQHASTPTFGQIAPILYANCTVCHRAGEIAPFPLVTYRDAVDQAQKIVEETSTREMPPWKAVLGYGNHADVRRLSDQQIAMIREWVDGGTPEGDPGAVPPPPVFPSGSQLGVPDLVLRMAEPYTHVGNGQDMYRCFVIPSGLAQDRTIAAIEFRPGNGRIVHHALIYADTTGAGRARDAADPGPGYVGFGGPGFEPAATFTPWAPGATTRLLPPGLVGRMPKNCDIVIQIHYAPIDSDEIDQSSLNVFFARPGFSREVLQFMMSPDQIVNGPFIIPAGQTRRFTARYPVGADVSLLAVAPHMHLLGREMKAYAVTPVGDTIPCVWINDWDFHWQGAYTFHTIVKIPKGSTLCVESMYDNTADNPENPSTPPKTVGWGESTLDEMMVCYFFYTYYLPGDENIVLDASLPAGIATRYDAGALALECLPNPMRGTSTMRFTLPAADHVTLSVCDLLGRTIATLADERFAAGTHSVTFDAAASMPDGRLVPGSYFCRMTTSHGTTVRAIVAAP